MSSRTQRKQERHKRSARRRMLLTLLGGFLLLGLAAFLARPDRSAPSAPVEVTGAPRLKVDRETVDLGEVALGQNVEVSFQVANVGDRQLRLTGEPYIEVMEGC